jgi:protein-tyrosine phosphatase
MALIFCFPSTEVEKMSIVARILPLSALLFFCAVIFPTAAVAQNVLAPGTSMGIASVPNLRDAGGYTTADGSIVRRGIAYRSNQLNPISPDDMKKIAALGLENDFDLRTAEERETKPDELPAGVKNVWLNVLADAKGVSPAEVDKMITDPKLANAQLGDGKASAAMEKTYREFITLPSANAAFRKLFVDLGEKDQLPALYHCTTGKDRTGWASAALLTLLGVPEDKVYEDYLKSNEYILPAYKNLIDRFVASGGQPSIPQDLLSVKAAYLQASFDQVKTQYGSIENYFDKGLGIDQTGQQKLRDQFLQVKK